MPPSFETERMRILEMVEQGSITSAEAIRLLDALSGSDPSKESPMGIAGLIPSEPGSDVPIEDNQIPPEGLEPPVSQNDPNMDEWRRWWRFPLAIGALVSLASGLLLYQAYRTIGYGFWFFCTWVPLALGLVVMLLAWFSRTARWLHLRIYQSSGEWPQRIALSFPLPIRFSAWVLRRFGKWIPILEGTSIDELLLALDETTSSNQPFYVEVEDDDEGDRVQVYIG